ncbi:MAG: sigma-70 family RNA polymerase sigma factor [bacterium]|nr:sigma-70 family RNA polymerase sigma factor [bacterium]
MATAAKNIDWSESPAPDVDVPRPYRSPPAIPPQSPISEADMVRGLRAGDADAVTTFALRCHRAVFALALRLCPDSQLRHDWTHDVILRLIEEMKRGDFAYRRPGCFWAWYRKRAYYLMLNQLNHLHSRRRLELTDTHLADVSGDPGESPAIHLERSEIRRQYELCLNQIPNADQRRALNMFLHQMLSYREIAEEMNASLNTVRSWIRRGRVALRSSLAQRLELAPPDGRR